MDPGLRREDDQKNASISILSRPRKRGEVVKELTFGWINAVRPSRQPLRGFLRMTSVLHTISTLPHAEERSRSASRSAHNMDATVVSNFRTHSFAGMTIEGLILRGSFQIGRFGH
jgi:hypothetical protein